jgi:hypothetical protein
MATFSQLNGAEQQRWLERGARAQQRYGISHEDWITLCDAENTLSRWAERECNGEVQRDEPSDRWPLGRPRRMLLDRWESPTIPGPYISDHAAAAMRRAKSVLVGKPDLMIYWQTDPRGAQIYLYLRSECLARGGDISGLYATLGTACFY